MLFGKLEAHLLRGIPAACTLSCIRIRRCCAALERVSDRAATAIAASSHGHRFVCRMDDALFRRGKT